MFTTNIINYFFFFDKAGFSKTYPSSLNLKFFSKINPSFFTIKEGSTSHLGLLPSGKKRKPPYSVLKPLRYKVGGPSEVYASSELRFLCGDEPAFTQGFAKGLLARCFFLKSTRPSFIDKAGCTRQFESELSLRSLAQLFPIKEGSFENPPVLPYP